VNGHIKFAYCIQFYNNLCRPPGSDITQWVTWLAALNNFLTITETYYLNLDSNAANAITKVTDIRQNNDLNNHLAYISKIVVFG